MNEAKLKACPFCGSEVVMKDTGNNVGYRWLVRCDNALCMVNPYARSRNVDAALAIWNQRAGGSNQEQPQRQDVITSASSALFGGVTDDFRARVSEMSAEEMRDRIINQASHIAAYQTCLDGLGLKTPGVLESHRRPADIRKIVEGLATPPNS